MDSASGSKTPSNSLKGRFSLNENFENFETGGKHVGNIPGQFPENTKTVEF